MFTGIVQDTGRICGLQSHNGDCRMDIECPRFELSDLALGDSIAVNGVCLTAVSMTEQQFSVDISRESLQRTTLGALGRGAIVNLEKALRLQDRLGGHLVSGHVDGLGEVVSVAPDARSTRIVFSLPAMLQKYIAVKGSVCIDGVSLTVNDVSGAQFGANLVPHTVSQTSLDQLRRGDNVNIEVDMIARYLERLLTGGEREDSISEQQLKRFGFLGRG